MKEVLYVLSSGSWLKREGEALLVMREGRVQDRIPLGGLKRLVLLGRSSLSSGLLDFLVKRGIDTVFATPDGRFRAVILGDPGSHVERRMAQYRKLSCENSSLEMSAILVAGKVATFSLYLKHRGKTLGNRDLLQSVLRIEACSPLEEDRDPARLRGLEGAASRMYFQAFSGLIQNPAFRFQGRNRRPPKDPVNAMLSYLYTVLFAEVLSAILTEGLDPWLGSLHELAPGRPALACDLMEE